MVARFSSIATVVLLSAVAVALAKPLPGVGRTFGYVPDAATAIRIAITVCEPIYGRKQIASEKPFHASLRNSVWHVEGYLPPNFLGGVAEADIRQRDGKVLRIEHGL